MTRMKPEEIIKEWYEEAGDAECAAPGYLYPDGWEADPATLVFCANELSAALQWIPVSEDLPEEKGRYEVWLAGDWERPAIVNWDRGSWEDDHSYPVGQVTHWRKAPAGPKLQSSREVTR